MTVYGGVPWPLSDGVHGDRGLKHFMITRGSSEVKD
jgi:hypothetical protein